MTLFSKIVAPALFALSASIAGAATVTEVIDLRGSGGLDDSYTFTSSEGMGVTATGHYLNSNGSIGAQALVGQYSHGLGVTTAATTSCHWWHCSHTPDEHYVDSYGPDEVVQFAFDSAVSISRIYFSYVSSWDDFSFSVISSGGGVMSFNGNLDILGHNYGYYDFSGPLAISSIFGIGAAGYGDYFKIAALEVIWEEETPAVPLPASALLMIGAFGTFGALRRRRKAA